MADFCKKTGGECYGIRELNLLLEISAVLNKPTHNLKDNLHVVVAHLAEYLHAERVILTILNRTNSQIYIEVGFGLTKAEQGKGTYNIGEGIIGKVVNCFVLFIEYNSEIVGLATCFINYSTFKAQPYINVHDIVIHSSMRGKQLGKLLMQKIIEIAHHYNCCKVTLEVREDNIVAQRMYKQLGFADTNPPMHFWTRVLE